MRRNSSSNWLCAGPRLGTATVAFLDSNVMVVLLALVKTAKTLYWRNWSPYHWRIYIGRCPAHGPLRIQILSFWHTKFSKCNRFGSPRPPYEVHAPLREILDPPLLMKDSRLFHYTGVILPKRYLLSYKPGKTCLGWMQSVICSLEIVSTWLGSLRFCLWYNHLRATA